MLRSISMHNFIHFNEPQRLEFQDGANFIIGGNSTGKTAIFELIRRCFSNKLNTTNSSFNKDGDLPYIVTHFKIPDNVESLPTKTSDILSCLFIEKIEKDSEVDEHKTFYKYYKVLCILEIRNTINVYINRYIGLYACNTDELSTLVPKYIQNENNELNFIRDIITNEDNKHKKCIKQLFDIIKLLDYDPLHTNDDSCKNMQVYFDWLDKSYVSVMAMRSIAPLQWTKSSKNSHSNRESNYRMACDRAEILNALLDCDQIDANLKQQFHQALVYPYTFKKETSGDITTIWVYNDEDKAKGPRRPLLKTPEGIVEAQQLVLLLAHCNLLTITLEEPDRGMHPHMIMKMRDWVLKKIKNKSVLIVSHQSSILDHDTFQRSHLCHKTLKSGLISHTVVKVPEGYKRYGTVDDIRQLLFSQRILGVEGIVDKIVMEAVLNLIITTNEKPFSDYADLRNYLRSIHVINMGGKGEGPKLKKFCEKIRRRSFVLYDLDALFPTKQEKGSTEIRLCGERLNTNFGFDQTFENIEAFLKDAEAIQKFAKACYQAEIFVWKYGTIEDVLTRIEEKIEDGDLAKRLGFPISQKWKQKLINKSNEYIEQLALTLLKHSDDVMRFFNFIRQMMENE